MKVSVIVVTYNNEQTIEGCSRPILAQPFDFSIEVIVVDNASSDGTVALINREFPEVRLIQNKENIGLAKAINRGIKASRGMYVLMLNPDTVVRKNALKKLVKFADSDPRIGIVGPRLLFPDGSVQKEAQRFPTLWPMIFWLFRLHRIPPFFDLPPLRGFLLRNFDYEKTQEAEHLMGAALLIRQEVFRQIGLLDENFWLWFEETDLEKRAKDAGWRVVYYPEAEVVHLVGESTRKMNPFKLRYIWNKSLRYYFQKHRPHWEQIVLEPFFWLSYLPIPLLVLAKKLIRR